MEGGRLGFMQLLLQGVAHERPNLLHGIGAGHLAAHLRVEVLRAGTSRFTCDGEAIAQHQDAEGQESERRKRRSKRLFVI